MTPRNLENKMKGYNKKVESDYFFQRQMTWLNLKMQGAKLKASQIWPLELDEITGTDIDIPTSSETAAIIKEFKRINPKLFRPKPN